MSDENPVSDVRISLAHIAAKLDYTLAGQEQLKDGLREVREDIKEVRQALDSVPGMMDARLKNYVTTDQFAPVRSLVFGLVSLVGVALVGALMSVLLRVP
jgi:NifB/MoaA-like Fe-S oxidoreductase